MANSLNNIVSYFHDCYRSDNRDQVINDFLKPKIENKIYIEGREELLTGEHPIIPINSDKAHKIVKKLEVFQKEKELLYGVFFVGGHYIDFKGDTQQLCAPLFLFPAEIEIKDEFHYLSIQHQERRINYPLIQMLSKESEGDILEDPLFKQIPKGFIEFGQMSVLVKLCKKYFPGLSTENAYHFPDNFSVKNVRQKIKEMNVEDITSTVLIPTSMLGIVSKSVQTRGVLNELSQLAKSNEFSNPLKALLTNQGVIPRTMVDASLKLPMVLSDAQKALIKSSKEQPLTLIVGPPGTGKSFTIGAIAIDHMTRGESVLIASRTNEAVDVIADKIEGQLGVDKCVVRGGRRRAYTTPLNKHLRALLTRVHPMRYMLKEFELSTKLNLWKIDKTIWDLDISIFQSLQKINELENLFSIEIENEINWGRDLANENPSLWIRLKKKYLKIRNNYQKPIWEISEQLQNLDDLVHAKMLRGIKLKFVQQVVRIIKDDWQEIKNFYEALKLKSDTDKLKAFEEINFQKVFKAFPIWMTNLAEVKDVLPFEKEMFDVVIIDEATQCDIASCLPLMQRAKRVVFAGDPNQLRHVSFLSRSMQAMLQAKFQLTGKVTAKLNYRDQSILDIAMGALQSSEQVAMLDEHYRSVTPIIAFSNHQFYDNALRVMNERPDETEQGLYFEYCSGIRDKNGTNKLEAIALLKVILQHITEEKELNEQLCSTMGILSPFRAQVDLLAKMVIEKIPIRAIEKHKIRVGTAYSFQGEERDQMYLSFAIDAQSHHSAFIHINKPDVFNVSITRARKQQFIFSSITPKEAQGGSLLGAYLSNAQHLGINSRAHSLAHDNFAEEVITLMEKWKIKTYWTDFSIAGLHMDLLIKYEGDYIGIDLVGYPGELTDVFGLERYRILHRAGVFVFPLPYSDWYFEPQETQKVFERFLRKKRV